MGFSFECTQWELSNEYQHDKVKIFFFKSLISCAIDKVALALEGLNKYEMTLLK